MNTNLDHLIKPLKTIAANAGQKIMEIYKTDYVVETKQDKSPVTAADQASHNCIVSALGKLTPNIPILSEESATAPWVERSKWQEYWLIDPLDGTKEFIKRNDEFTVNIALIQGHQSVLGVVYVPAMDKFFYGHREIGAFEQDASNAPQSITVRTTADSPVRVVGSRSHRGGSMDAYLYQLGDHVIVPMGSSLKLCLIANGMADIYPRLGLTSEWDTAAAQAVVESAGGTVIQRNGQPLLYNAKEDILNPEFLAFGDRSRNWIQYLSED